MDQDVVWTLVGFGFLAVAIIGVKILVHLKANKMEAERQAQSKQKANEDQA